MLAVDLIVGDYVHRLPKGADEIAVLADLTDAVHAGGGVVDLPTNRSQSTVAVLISPGVPVFIERTVVQDDAVDDVSASFDLDVAEWADF